jgi:hypothetical protein
MPMKVIRKSSKGSKRSKTNKRTKKHQRGGAIYSFDLNDKIGGLPANIPLNGTADGDCPGSPTSELGFVNYGLTRGGDRKHKKHSKSHRSKSHRSKSHCSKSHRSKSHRNKKARK